MSVLVIKIAGSETASMESIWPRTGWAGSRAEPSWSWNMRRTWARLWRSTGSTWVLATSKVGHSWVTVEVWAADGKHTVNSLEICEDLMRWAVSIFCFCSVWSDKQGRWRHPEKSHPDPRGWWSGAAQRSPLQQHWGRHRRVFLRLTAS